MHTTPKTPSSFHASESGSLPLGIMSNDVPLDEGQIRQYVRAELSPEADAEVRSKIKTCRNWLVEYLRQKDIYTAERKQDEAA